MTDTVSNEPTPGAMQVAVDFAYKWRSGASHKQLALTLDAFAARRVAEKDAEIARLRGMVAGRDQLLWNAAERQEKQDHEIAALKAEIDGLRAHVEWRPIAEYPRDHDPGADTHWGPNVLLFVPTGMVALLSDYRILTGRLEADMWLGWDDQGSMWDVIKEPSHFVPLPAPPSHTIPSKGDDR